MRSTFFRGSVVVLLSSSILVTGCGQDKTAAEVAMKAAEQSVGAVKDEAGKYVPDQLKAVTDALDSAKASFEKGDYKAALSAAQDLPTKANALVEAVTAKKTELTKSWQDMSTALPKTVESIKSRIDSLSKSKKLPAEVDATKFEGAKAGLAAINQSWTDASAAYKNGNLAEAVSKATAAKEKSLEAMQLLGMTPVPAAS